MRTRARCMAIGCMAVLLLTGCGRRTQRTIDGVNESMDGVVQNIEKTESSDPLDFSTDAPITDDALPDPKDPDQGFYSLVPEDASLDTSMRELQDALEGEGYQGLPTKLGTDVKLYGKDGQIRAIVVISPESALEDGLKVQRAIVFNLVTNGANMDPLEELELRARKQTTSLNSLINCAQLSLRSAFFDGAYHWMIMPLVGMQDPLSNQVDDVKEKIDEEAGKGQGD